VFLWLAIASGLILANVFQSTAVGLLGVPRDVSMAAALSLLLCGLILRWTAILTLGRFFSPTVAVRPGQKVVQSGVFRHVRHPAYSGLLLAFCGAGVAYGNWLSLVVLLVPVMAALAYRIGVEERMLVGTFGHEYEEYRSRTKRLVPFIY
jgi:protein-S-isoprenylcysteine O-methyltransferase Ste14